MFLCSLGVLLQAPVRRSNPPSIIIQFKLNLLGAQTLLIFSVSGFEKKQKSIGEEKKKKNVLTLARQMMELAQWLQHTCFKVVYLLYYRISGRSSPKDECDCKLVLFNSAPAAARQSCENQQ